DRTTAPAVLVFDPEPIDVTGLERPCRDIRTRGMIGPIINYEAIVKIDPNPGIRSRSKDMQRRRNRPDNAAPSHGELQRQSAARTFGCTPIEIDPAIRPINDRIPEKIEIRKILGLQALDQLAALVFVRELRGSEVADANAKIIDGHLRSLILRNAVEH